VSVFVERFVKIPELPPATTPLTGAELFEAVQGSVSVRLTAADLVAPVIALNLQAAPLAAGANNDFALAVFVGFLDLDTTAGAAQLTGMFAQFNGQVVTISNTGPNLLTLSANSGLSFPANRFRLPANVGVVANGSYTLRYCAPLSQWLALS
jgi:hypothetical protein